MTRDITRGILDRRRPLIINAVKSRWESICESRQEVIPKQVLKYAKGVAKVTGLQMEQVLKSKPVRKYRDKIWFRE